MSIDTIQQQLSEYYRNITLNRKEHAGYTTEKKKTKTPSKTRFDGCCSHCGFYGHDTPDCKGKQKGLPPATEEQKVKRKLYCKVCHIAGSHNTVDHVDKDKKKKTEEEEKEYGGRATHVCQQFTWWQYLIAIMLRLISFMIHQKEHAYMAKTAITFKHSFDNWLLESGASAHMTPYREDLEDITRCNIIVTLAGGSEIRCN